MSLSVQHCMDLFTKHNQEVAEKASCMTWLCPFGMIHLWLLIMVNEKALNYRFFYILMVITVDKLLFIIEVNVCQMYYVSSSL